jgi:serine/threonine protein kinase
MWKRLKHKNIVALLGITTTPVQLISEWMVGGDLTDYIAKYPGTNRVGLVSVTLSPFHHALTPTVSYLMLLKDSTTYIPST